MKKLPVYQIKKFNCKSEENDLYVNDFKSHLKNNDFIENSHSHNFYLLVLFTHGTGTHTIDFDQFEIKTGHLYILKPGQIHSWELSENIDGYITFYSQEAYNLYFGNKKIEEYPFYRTLKNSPEIVLNKQQLIEIRKYFELLMEENKKEEFKKQDKLLNLIDIIHVELARIYNSMNDHIVHSYNLKINELENLVNLHFKTEKLASFYADKMNISLKHLNRICKNVLNITLTEFIYSKIILESKRLLSANEKVIGEVANELGFENYSYFTKVFKKHTGLTPQNFKKQLHS
ncbi:helix-turn-helix domain-containing protein [Flavobacterium eburneipallidum]|uniref:helix-turn-helix domain-containing protein n=1 Tax=Flavobacterium eburneipallidum TaxID=3003263 RepID=UPI0022ABF7AA|nr:helix-turn-helix transcriptional regulator [Flavobacterium eburneipallidum]